MNNKILQTFRINNNRIIINKSLVFTNMHLRIFNELIKDHYIEIRTTREYENGYKEAIQELEDLNILIYDYNSWHSTWHINKDIIDLNELQNILK